MSAECITYVDVVISRAGIAAGAPMGPLLKKPTSKVIPLAMPVIWVLTYSYASSLRMLWASTLVFSPWFTM